jgi:hypothetical protein
LGVSRDLPDEGASQPLLNDGVGHDWPESNPLQDIEPTDKHVVFMELKSEFPLAWKFNPRKTILVDG